MGVLLPATILLSLLSGAQLATKKGEKIIGSPLPRPPPSSFLCSHFPCFPSWSPSLPTQLASIIPPLLPDPQLSQALLLLLLLLLLFLNPHLSQMLLLILNIWPPLPLCSSPPSCHKHILVFSRSKLLNPTSLELAISSIFQTG